MFSVKKYEDIFINHKIYWINEPFHYPMTELTTEYLQNNYGKLIESIISQIESS